MSWWKEKKNLRLRRCQANLSDKCQNIFKTKFKRTGRRLACRNCRIYLKKLGTNLEELIKMEEPIEKIEWENKDKAVFKAERLIKIKNDEGKTVGTKKESYNQNTTANEIIEGINNLKERNNKETSEMLKLRNQLLKLGDIPVKSNEQVRLEKNLQVLMKINRAKDIEKKIRPMEDSIITNEKTVRRREELLKTRPRK